MVSQHTLGGSGGGAVGVQEAPWGGPGKVWKLIEICKIVKILRKYV